MIYDDAGRPVQNVTVELEGHPIAITDLNGRFVILSVLPGEYLFKAHGSGLESYTKKLSLMSSSDVFYLSMISFEGIVHAALEALKGHFWQKSKVFIDRALLIEPGNAVARFALACVLYAPGNPDRDYLEAKILADALLADGNRDAVIYLMQADIAQYDEKDYAATAIWLQKAQAVKSDPVVAERLAAILNSGS